MGALFAPVELSEEDIAEVFKIEQPISEGDDNMGLLAAPSNLFSPVATGAGTALPSWTSVQTEAQRSSAAPERKRAATRDRGAADDRRSGQVQPGKKKAVANPKPRKSRRKATSGSKERAASVPETDIIEKKRLHAAAEKKRQQKISLQIQKLKEMIEGVTGESVGKARHQILGAACKFVSEALEEKKKRVEEATSPRSSIGNGKGGTATGELPPVRVRKSPKTEEVILSLRRLNFIDKKALSFSGFSSLQRSRRSTDLSLQFLMRIEMSAAERFLELDQNLIVQYASTGVRSGRSMNMLGRHYIALVHIEDRDRVESYMKALFSTQFAKANVTVALPESHLVFRRSCYPNEGFDFIEAVFHSIGPCIGTRVAHDESVSKSIVMSEKKVFGADGVEASGVPKKLRRELSLGKGAMTAARRSAKRRQAVAARGDGHGEQPSGGSSEEEEEEEEEEEDVRVVEGADLFS